MEANKKWYTSTTVWFNVVSFIVGVFVLLAAYQPLEQYAPLFVLLQAVANLALRVFLTAAPITDTAAQRAIKRGK